MSKTAHQLKKLTDREIIERVLQNGDTSPLGILYDRYADKVYRKCISMLKNRDDAQDLTHDILVKAFLNIANFEGTAAFSTWVYAITYNQCIDFLRVQQKNTHIDYEENDEVMDRYDEDTVEEKKMLEIEVGRLGILIHQLNQDDKAVLLMKYQDEMSVEEIMHILTLSESAVKMRLKRARDRLRKIYEQTYGKN